MYAFKGWSGVRGEIIHKFRRAFNDIEGFYILSDWFAVWQKKRALMVLTLFVPICLFRSFSAPAAPARSSQIRTADSFQNA